MVETVQVSVDSPRQIRRATIDASALLRTLHTYPLVLTDVVLTRRGSESQTAYADPRRGDLIRPAS